MCCAESGIPRAASPRFGSASAAVHDVPACFRAIPPKVRRSPFFGSTDKYLGARNDTIRPPDFTTQPANLFGFGEHFQGVQRVGSRLVLSGGINRGAAAGSRLVVIQMGSRRSPGPWALPRYAGDGHSYAHPRPEDASVEQIFINEALWHAGGIQAADGVVAVPIFGPCDWSRIEFFDLEQEILPTQRRVPVTTLHKSRMKAKAVGLTTLRDRYVLAIWDDERLDFHVSCSERLEDGFDEMRFERFDRLSLPEGFFPRGFPVPSGTYQSVSLVRDCSPGAPYPLYLVGTRNTKQWSPYLPGADFAELHGVRWPRFGDRPSVEPLKAIEPRQMYCYNQQCNFGAAAGVYTEGQHRLWIYAAAHWLHDGNARFNFSEYSYEPACP